MSCNKLKIKNIICNSESNNNIDKNTYHLSQKYLDELKEIIMIIKDLFLHEDKLIYSLSNIFKKVNRVKKNYDEIQILKKIIDDKK